ncbi:hypothetical protein [Candidatus Venteria ishoeyi]|uniref:Uncharacterized protein n=1 Tax=Candidatus Venteria ishoeyi TaxID=1899563 RepID=A0A1H6F8A1_9GAMM|nr:hypothetical protein [Candidatus Venteria ishoeyi]SEH05284.1 Uncharacterised protein [Candidatus Venteria ishoeyi]
MKKNTPTLQEKQREFWKYNLNPITGHREVAMLNVNKIDQTATQLKPNNNAFKGMIV